jgi:phosphohistidine phosphatase
VPLIFLGYSRESQVMNLYILRHASAGTSRANPLLDVKRPLDKEGKQQCLLIANYLNSFNLQLDVIVSSPLKRALQTASYVGNEIGFEAKIMISEALSPGASVAAFQKLLAELGQHENVLVVGHNPNLQQFLGSLVASPRPASIRLRKGGIARVDMTKRPPTLNWLIDPRPLKAFQASVGKSSRRKTSRK